MKKASHCIAAFIAIDLSILIFTGVADAESMRCKGNLIDVGDTKSEVVKKCGEPESTDAFCEATQQRVPLADGTYTLIEKCEDVQVWTYDRGRGKFATDLVFTQGKIREIRYGDRSE